MPSLKDLKNRIGSVRSTQKITKAMQMVAAAKLRRAEEAAVAARPYAERMEGVVANLSASVAGNPDAPKLLAGTGSEETHLLIVATSDKGLCGGFNSSIVRLAREAIVRLQGEGKTVKIVTVGKKGRDQLKRLYGGLLVRHIDTMEIKRVAYADAKGIADTVLEMFEEGEFDVAHLFYGRYKSVISQVPTVQQIIPAKAPEGIQAPDLKGAIYEYEPDEEEILKVLLPRYVGVQIFRAMLENAASEQGARMSAMDNATRNAGDMIDKLNLQYNRARQAQITKELIEIISGAEAL
ncbi:F0F1 ATP synthase subunit gamma [Aquisalinus flavus]|uniref:ATP synthase gamma chain n=1 Tax=Aquisalinus flavus TaxID=1526572 RepID=A0A8J2Y5W2_9PROT|nr:F0F1 ATP synthase subunit gamma [Aquisalinus flavus]MBD0425280.1 F0F1 ATP synthase subunit gamma [Aquisalinus flavus]UNE49067.1 F0F1 ATP synthase subunit gamma [Aquisalinus flavus]GGD17291.1 ATP synthase gamma chain [Aquisalinus flavus]